MQSEPQHAAPWAAIKVTTELKRGSKFPTFVSLQRVFLCSFHDSADCKTIAHYIHASVNPVLSWSVLCCITLSSTALVRGEEITDYTVSPNRVCAKHHTHNNNIHRSQYYDKLLITMNYHYCLKLGNKDSVTPLASLLSHSSFYHVVPLPFKFFLNSHLFLWASNLFNLVIFKVAHLTWQGLHKT